MLIAAIVLALINIVSHETVLHLYWSIIHYTPPATATHRTPHLNLWLVNDASSAFLVMAGTVVSLWYSRLAAKDTQQRILTLLAIAGFGAIIAGLLIRPYTEGISKIRSTPSWIFICAGISILVFELMIYLVDYKGKKNWFKFIWPAGTSTLTCYLLPYFQVAIMSLIYFHYPRFLDEGIGGFLRSWAVAFIIVWIGGILEKRRLRLKI
jgi:heparan-alpha-glucosaminide N-acetyltransferase